MTIQLSVLLWTVICFCLFVLIVNNFLFKPLFRVMDARQEKIDRAAQKKEDHARAVAEAEKALAAFRVEEERHLADLVQEEVAKAKKEADELLVITHRRQNQNLDLHVASLEAEACQIEERMDARLEELSKLYASTLLS